MRAKRIGYDRWMSPTTPPSKSGQRRRPVFYYDGGCGFCHSGVWALARIDFSHRVDWVAFQSLESPPGGLSSADLDRAAYLETDTGRRYEGFFAFRQLTRRLYPLLILYPLLLLPGMDRLGVAVYRRVARNRHRLWPFSSCPREGGDGSAGP